MPSNEESVMLAQLRASAEKGARARKEAIRAQVAKTHLFVDQKRPIRQNPIGAGKSPVLDQKRKAAEAAARKAAAAKAATKSES